MSDTDYQVDPVQEESTRGIKKAFSGFKEAYADPESGRNLRFTMGFIVVVAVAWAYVGPDLSSKVETENYTQSGKRGTNATTKESSNLSDEEKAIIIAEEEEARLEAQKQGKSFVADRHSLVDWSKNAAPKSDEDRVNRKTAVEVEKLISKGASVAEIALKSADVANSTAKKLKVDPEVAAMMAAKIAYQNAIKQGADVVTAISLAGQSAFAAAVENGLSKEEAARIAIDAAYEAAIQSGMTTPEALEIAAESSFSALIASGVEKSKAIEMVADSLLAKAIAEGLSIEEALALLARTVYKLAIESGYPPIEARALVSEEVYQGALEYDLEEYESIAIAIKNMMATERSTFSDIPYSLHRIHEFTEFDDSEAVENTASISFGQIHVDSKAELQDLRKTADMSFEIATIRKMENMDGLSETVLGLQSTLILRGDSKSIALKKSLAATRHIAQRLSIPEKDLLLAAVEKTRERNIEQGLSKREALDESLLLLEGVVGDKSLHEEFISLVADEDKLTNRQKQRLLSEYLDEYKTDSQKEIELRTSSSNKEVRNGSSESRKPTPESTEEDENTAKIALIFTKLLKEQEEDKSGSESKKSNRSQAGVTSTIESVEEGSEAQDSENSNDTVSDQMPSDIARTISGTPDVAAGQFLYGVTLTNIDTDVANNQVLAVIAGGPFDGARAFGEYQKLGTWAESVSLVFNRLNLNGQEIDGVELVAFDGDSKLPAFATDVNRHILTRYGGLALRGVSAGLKAKVDAERDVSLSIGEDGVTARENKSGVGSEEGTSLLIAGFIDEVSSKADQMWERPITVSVDYGQQMKLLVMNNLYLPEDYKK